MTPIFFIIDFDVYHLGLELCNNSNKSGYMPYMPPYNLKSAPRGLTETLMNAVVNERFVNKVRVLFLEIKLS